MKKDLICDSKKTLLFFLFSFIAGNKLIAQQNVTKLFEVSLKNNTRIITAQSDYETALLLSKNGGDAFAPGIVLSGSGKSKENYSTSITYKQPIPGGAAFQITGSYDYSLIEMMGTKVETKTPSISFSFNQNLFPFWVAGQLEDTAVLSYKLQAEYYYSQLLYTKQAVVTELLQNCVGAVTENNKIRILKNSIGLLQLQEKALQELKNSGGSNEARILELENSRWSYEQEILSGYSSLSSYIQSIKTLCGEKLDSIDEEWLSGLIPEGYTSDEFIRVFKLVAEYDKDPYSISLELKIKLAENNIINSKQNGAPVLCFSAAVPVDIENKKADDWTFGVSLDFSPLFSSFIAHNQKRAELELQKARIAYSTYLAQKEFIKEQYGNVIAAYEQQLKELYDLIAKSEVQLHEISQQLKKGAITQLDYENEKVRLDNYKLTYDNLRLYKWLYEVLREFTF